MLANKSLTLSKLCSLLPPKLRSMSSYRSTMLLMGSILPAAGMDETQFEQTAKCSHSRSCRWAPYRSSPSRSPICLNRETTIQK